MESSTNGQAGELEQAVAELRENPYDLATLYNDFAVKYRVREAGNSLDVSTRRTQPWQRASRHCIHCVYATRGNRRSNALRGSQRSTFTAIDLCKRDCAGVASVPGDGGVGRFQRRRLRAAAVGRPPQKHVRALADHDSRLSGCSYHFDTTLAGLSRHVSRRDDAWGLLSMFVVRTPCDGRGLAV